MCNMMMTKSLLIVTALLEGGTGLALVVSPSVIVSLLSGTALEAPGALAIGRIAGAAVLSLGAACWLARHDEKSRAAAGLIATMLLYNTAAVAVLADAFFGSGLTGVGLWPGLVLHVAMALWCIACLRTRRAWRGFFILRVGVPTGCGSGTRESSESRETRGGILTISSFETTESHVTRGALR
jgi:hypothetical protein